MELRLHYVFIPMYCDIFASGLLFTEGKLGVAAYTYFYYIIYTVHDCVSVYSQMLIFNSKTQTGPGEMFEVSNSPTILSPILLTMLLTGV